jgi:integrase
MDMSFFRNEKRIMEILKDKAPSTRKTMLAAIVVLNGKEHTNETFTKQMMDDVKTTTEELNNQVKTKKQDENWVEYDVVKDFQHRYELEALKRLDSKGKLSEPDKEFITRYMMLTLSSGVYMPPRRNEMCLIKIKDIDESKDNYIDMANSEFVYNQYKTVRKYGEQRVGFLPAFKVILKKYLAKVKGQTYLLEHKGQPFLSTELTKELYKIFGKKISTSMMRHIYLSAVYANTPGLVEMNKRAHDMGQSVGIALTYVKR